MFFRKKTSVHKHAKKFDKLITGLIIGGAIGGVFGLYKVKNKTGEVGKTTAEIEEGNEESSGSTLFKKGYSVFGKGLVGILKIFNKK